MISKINMLLFPKHPCPTCQGKGFHLCVGTAIYPLTCDSCDGSGEVGDPRVGIVVILATALSTIAPIIWVIRYASS